MNYKIIWLLIATLIACPKVSSQNNSETRNYIKTLPAGRGTNLEISNKYGTIQVVQWKKDSALIRAEIKAYAGNRDKLDKMFEGININITQSGSHIMAETSFTQNINRLFENFKGMTSKIISYDSL